MNKIWWRSLNNLVSIVFTRSKRARRKHSRIDTLTDETMEAFLYPLCNLLGWDNDTLCTKVKCKVEVKGIIKVKGKVKTEILSPRYICHWCCWPQESLSTLARVCPMSCKLKFLKSRSNFNVKVTRSKTMVQYKRSCHKECICEIWKPHLMRFKSCGQG